MPTLPIVPVTIPAVLAGQSNGRLPSAILWDTPGQAGGATVRLVEPAARAWRALTAAALERGHILKPTSLSDSYRPYSVQLSIFRARYTTENLPGRPSKLCGGVRYWLRDGSAPAACPGTSNHGWGLAVDVGEERDGDGGTESIDALTLQWLVDNAGRFGFSGELQVEPWHWRYYAGDDIPDAVLAYEEEQMALTDDDVTKIWNRDTDADPNVNRSAWRALDSARRDAAAALAGVEELKARPPVQAAPVDPAAIKAALMDPEVMAAYAKAINDDLAKRVEE